MPEGLRPDEVEYARHLRQEEANQIKSSEENKRESFSNIEDRTRLLRLQDELDYWIGKQEDVAQRVEGSIRNKDWNTLRAAREAVDRLYSDLETEFDEAAQHTVMDAYDAKMTREEATEHKEQNLDRYIQSAKSEAEAAGHESTDAPDTPQ